MDDRVQKPLQPLLAEMLVQFAAAQTNLAATAADEEGYLAQVLCLRDSRRTSLP